MGDGGRGTYWVAGFALATQSAFPSDRLREGGLYDAVLSALEQIAWKRRPTIGSVFAVNATSALVSPDVAMVLDRAFGALPEEVDVCIVDLRPANRTRRIFAVYPRSFATIGDTLYRMAQMGVFGDTHLLVIVPELGTPEDYPFRTFAALSRTDRLSIVDTRGSVWSTRYNAPKSRDIAAAFSADRPENSEALQTKMIRRLGYFPQLDGNGDVEAYTRYFFDGRYCTQEIRALLFERILPLVPSSEGAAIVYEGDVSAWLGGPLLEVVSDLRRELDRDDIRAVARAEFGGDPSGKSLRTAIVLHPVVHRGRSFGQLVEETRNWAPAATITGICVVTTGGENRPEQMRVADEEIQLQHLMTAGQLQVRRTAFSPDPSYYEATVRGEERFLSFTSGDFWQLVREAGFTPERDPQDYRNALRCVPDLLKFVERNGAWIANKIEVAIEVVARRRAIEVSLALVAEEQGATRLADTLAETLGNAPLRVPRQALTDWETAGRSNGLLEKWRREGTGWLRDADGAPEREVVVVDEFAYSGKTLGSMASLLEAVGFDVRLVLALAVFSRRSVESTLSGYESFALYETEWRDPPAQARIEARAK